MEQFDQLLTCAICLDRYRNPKLLPCQHSFCMEPCMEGLVDYVRRQVKCPECRAEHRIPYQGVTAFPTNVTLQRFLELHIEITGELPDPTTGQVMERCNVCSDKNYCTLCAHCDKKVCPECREAHMDVLKREIARINNQIRRTLHRLQDVLAIIEKNTLNLQQNCTSVTEEIDEIYRRLAKALKDRVEGLKGEIERYMSCEVHNLVTLKDNLEQEIANIQSNCDLVEGHMTETSNSDWDDCELMDTKDIFLRTVEFIRSFEYEAGDYSRRVRFSVTQDPNQLNMTLATLGDLTIHTPGQLGNNLTVPTGPGLLRSKSDHRLASQFRQQQEDRGYAYDGEGSGRTSPTANRRFGERRDSRYPVAHEPRYGRTTEYTGEFDSPSYDADNRRSRYRSRFTRHLQDNADSDNEPSSRSVRFNEQEPGQRKERERVLDTEDVARGPLSGITRLFDSPRVMKRLQDTENKDKKKDKETSKPAAPTPAGKPATPWRAAQRQVSEDDEIAKQKKLNKDQPGERQRKASTSQDETPRHTTARQESLQTAHEEETPNRRRSTTTTQPTVTTPTTKAPEEQRPSTQGKASTTYSRTSSGSSENLEEIVEPGKTPGRVSLDRFKPRSNSSDSTASSTGTETSSGSTHNTGAAFTTDEVKQKYLSNSKEPPAPTVAAKDTNSGSTSSRYSSASSTARGTAVDTSNTARPTGTPRFQSRFLGRAATPTAEASKESESSSSEEEETSSASESEEEEEEVAPPPPKEKAKSERELSKTDIGPLLARSANARDSGTKKDDVPPPSPYSTRPRGSVSSTGSSYTRNDPAPAASSSSTYGGERENSYASRYGLRDRDNDRDRDTYGTRDSGSSTYGSSARDTNAYGSRDYGTSRDKPDYSSGITRSRTTGGSLYGRDEPTSTTESSRYPLTSKYARARAAAVEEEPPPTSRYTSRFLNRSKSSAAIAPDKEEEEEEEKPASRRLSGDDTMYPSGRSRYTALKDRRSRVARSRSSHDLGLPDEEEPEASTGGSSYLSRYGAGKTALKSRENSPEKADKDGASGSSSLSSWARYLKNKYGSRTKDGVGATPSASATSVSSAGTASSGTAGQQVPRSRSSLALGLPSRTASIESSDDDQKNSPTSPTSHTAAGFGDLPRNQYLQKRRLLFKIGSRGSEPGYFTWPRGVAVGPDNTIVVADSSNHRVQVFDDTGTFVKEFGTYGNAEGEFDCLAGVAVNRIGQYIIADRYNHRIQVFDPSGRFLRAFGSQGSSDGRFNYPWGITTDALGFLYVCDKENHRVQVFQSDGTFVGKFCSMGNKSGQLEHPHYIAVSSTNRVIVSDSHNHRIQIFDVNGKVLTSFGTEGSEEGQFKFPRGVAVDDQGYIFVGDSGNNRIQIFHPDGNFLRAFGCWGSGDGEFKGLEDLAVMSNGSILVCDRENHRIQVF